MRGPEVGMTIRRTRSWSLRRMGALVAGLLAASALTAVAVPAAQASTVASGFQDTVVLSGLTNPTAVRFASDGRVFVAQKNGMIQVFSSLGATTSTTFADLRANVDDYWDRGLLGMALDPNFPVTPYVYVLY